MSVLAVEHPRLTVVLVEDDDADAKAMRRALSGSTAAGTVLRAVDGVAALDLLRGAGRGLEIPQRQRQVQELPRRERFQPLRRARLGHLAGLFQAALLGQQRHALGAGVQLRIARLQPVQPGMARRQLPGLDAGAQELAAQVRRAGPARHAGPQIAKARPRMARVQQPFADQGGALGIAGAGQVGAGLGQRLFGAGKERGGEGAELWHARGRQPAFQRLLQRPGAIRRNDNPGAGHQELRHQRRDSRPLPQAVDHRQRGPGVIGLFSSEEDLTSQVAVKFQAGGYLSHFLRTGLTGEANYDGDDLITAGELTTYLRRKFAAEVMDVQTQTMDGQRSYQHLVVERGGVQVDDVVIRIGRG